MKVLVAILVSLSVLLGASVIQLLLKVASRRDSPGAAPRPLEWDDIGLWSDWTTNVLVAFGVFALKLPDSDGQLTGYQTGVLLGCAVLGLGVLPVYIRWVGTDPITGKLRRKQGLIVANVFSLIIIITAVSAGVNFY